MFTRKETSQIRQEFWAAFGRYMNLVPSAEGLKTNWINYHTGVKDVHFRMDAQPKFAAIYISMEHADPGIQELYFQQFLQLKTLLHETLEETWEWQMHVAVDGRVVSRIYKALPDASFLNKDDWPDLISFFKPRIIALDHFWENAKYSFDSLR